MKKKIDLKCNIYMYCHFISYYNNNIRRSRLKIDTSFKRTFRARRLHKTSVDVFPQRYCSVVRVSDFRPPLVVISRANAIGPFYVRV